jgi:predicted MFS family arabinose efflux permease
MWGAAAPLIPEWSRQFHLSSFEAGVLLASASLTIFAVSLPASWLGDRFGSRNVTLVAVGLMVIADVGQGLASDFWLLVCARLLFGVAFGTLWTTGIAWLTYVAPGRRERAVSLTVTVAGLGNVAGPAFAGVFVDQLGLAAPFVVAAAATAIVGLALYAWRVDEEPEPATHGETHWLLAMTRDPRILAAVVLMGLGGFVSTVINLLVPLQLADNGVSTAAVGVAFSAAAGLFILSSALVARRAERAATMGHAAVAALLIGLVLLVGIGSSSTPVQVGFLLARAPITALLFTIAFPLALVGGRAAGLSVTTVAALLNMVFAAAALLGPLAAGALDQVASDRIAYLASMALSLAVAAWMLRRRRESPPHAEPSASQA